MNSDRRRAGASGQQSSPAMPQQLEPPAMDRQQQQDNGTHEFQPSQPQGLTSSALDDAQHSLAAYLKRAGMRHELPSVVASAAQGVKSPQGKSRFI